MTAKKQIGASRCAASHLDCRCEKEAGHEVGASLDSTASWHEGTGAYAGSVRWRDRDPSEVTRSSWQDLGSEVAEEIQRFFEGHGIVVSVRGNIFWDRTGRMPVIEGWYVEDPLGRFYRASMSDELLEIVRRAVERSS